MAGGGGAGGRRTSAQSHIPSGALASCISPISPPAPPPSHVSIVIADGYILPSIVVVDPPSAAPRRCCVIVILLLGGGGELDDRVSASAAAALSSTSPASSSPLSDRLQNCLKDQFMLCCGFVIWKRPLPPKVCGARCPGATYPCVWKTDKRIGTISKSQKLVQFIKDLSNVKEDVYGALDSFAAWEMEFPFIAVKKTLKTLED